MHAKPDLRVFLKWMIAGSGSVITDVIRLLTNYTGTQMDDSLPPELIAKFTPAQLADAKAWWKALSISSRTEIIVLLDTRKNGRGYVYSVDDDGQRIWKSIPIEHETLPVHEHDDDKFWVDELIHYRLDHEDFVMASDMKECNLRSFGICSQHISAQQVIANAEIDGTFSCSNNDRHCPIKLFGFKFQHGVMLHHNPDTGNSLWLTR